MERVPWNFDWDDPELDTLLDAANVEIAARTDGDRCLGDGEPHALGYSHHCPVCRLYHALRPYSD